MRHPNRAQLTKTSKMSERKIETLRKDLHIPKKQLSTGFMAGYESKPWYPTQWLMDDYSASHMVIDDTYPQLKSLLSNIIVDKPH